MAQRVLARPVQACPCPDPHRHDGPIVVRAGRAARLPSESVFTGRSRHEGAAPSGSRPPARPGVVGRHVLIAGSSAGARRPVPNQPARERGSGSRAPTSRTSRTSTGTPTRRRGGSTQRGRSPGSGTPCLPPRRWTVILGRTPIRGRRGRRRRTTRRRTRPSRWSGCGGDRHHRERRRAEAAAAGELPGRAAEQDGNPIPFRVAFGEDAEVTLRALRKEAFDVTGGTVRRPSRVDGEQPDRHPTSSRRTRPLSRSPCRLSRTAAICTSHGRPLSNSNSATAAGLVGISVVDPRLKRTSGCWPSRSRPAARRPARSAWTTPCRTEAPRRASTTRRRVVRCHSWRARCQGPSRLRGSTTRTTRATTGTIENLYPRPGGLLVRFGRTAAIHLVAHVEQRLRAPRGPGFRGRFAGRSCGGEWSPTSRRVF